MIGPLMRIDWINLKRDRVALGLTFVLPVIFFSIFALIFGGMASGLGSGDGSGPTAINVIVVDEDGTDVSRRFTKAIDDQEALAVFTAPRATERDPAPATYTRESARQAVRSGRFPAAIILPAGFGEGFGNFATGGKDVEVIHDAANPIASNSVAGLLQAAAMMAAPDILMESGLEQLELAGGFLTDEQRRIIDRVKPAMRGEVPWESLDDDDDVPDNATAPAPEQAPAPAADRNAAFAGLVNVTLTDAREGAAASGTNTDEPRRPSIIAYYAAAIGVMFLLFSMAGASGSMLEDEERGTLERLLGSRLTMRSMLLGHWVFFSLVGVAQLIVMFLWGELVFGIGLFTIKRSAGFLLMALFTSGAAAAFGMFLATGCRSRAQLGGISTIVILIMSALGGSMVPRMIAPFIDKTSRFTFNGWALDGFQKIFWNDNPAHSLLESVLFIAPQLGVMTAMALAMLLIARVLARRWETV
jgi:ABC-2 type transport system permease protein